MRKTSIASVSLVVALAAIACARSGSIPLVRAARSAPMACSADNGGITLPAGFCATVFADSLGAARHLDVASNGDVFLNTQPAGPAPQGVAPRPFVVALRDTDGDGVADMTQRFGEVGGTGIALHKGFLYVDNMTSIRRYPVASGQL